MATRSPGFTPRSASAAASAHDFAVELEVRERARVARLAFPDDRGLGARAVVEVAIEAALGDVERRADEELRLRRVGPSSHSENVVHGVRHDEVGRLLAPEHVRLVERLLVASRAYAGAT